VVIRIRYRDGHGVLRTVLRTAVRLHFSVLDVDTDHQDDDTGRGDVQLALRVTGTAAAADLLAELSELDGVRSVAIDEPED
jgi:putative Mg2+ transporter-C (MgtC) family protein